MYLKLYKFIIKHREEMIMHICYIFDMINDLSFDYEVFSSFKSLLKVMKETNKTFLKIENKI